MIGKPWAVYGSALSGRMCFDIATLWIALRFYDFWYRKPTFCEKYLLIFLQGFITVINMCAAELLREMMIALRSSKASPGWG